MIDQQNSYRQIIKATTIFGGVQVFQVIIQIIRSKFIAVLLGPSGMGIMGLLSSTTSLISGFTNFGLRTSAVKEIAAANETGSEIRVATVATVVRRLVWITGMLGLTITIVLSPWLSRIAFGNYEYTSAFIWISIILLFTQLSSGQLVLMQGMRKLKDLAKATLFGSFIGLALTVPIYYKLRNEGIVPGMIVASGISLITSWFFAHRIHLSPVNISVRQVFDEGKLMLTMGFVISLSTLLAIGASYLIRVYIGRTGSLADVGLYSAGFSIVTFYVGMIFNAMGTDFYPRLSATVRDQTLLRQTINQQAEISVLILAPIVLVFLVFINWAIIILYSKQFVAINNMILWASLGMFFRVVIWIMGFLFLVKGDVKTYFWNEFASIIYTLVLNIIGYKYYGLTGLGISIFVSYLLAMAQASLISKFRFSFIFGKTFKRIFLFQFGIALLAFIAVEVFVAPYTYLVGLPLIIISFWYSYKELDRRLGLKSALVQLVKKITL